jgi:formylglycine-generating enzyme required for sulfatase activity
VLVPGGTFTMGSPEDESGREAHENPHEVTLSPFLISRTEVTQSAWLRVYAYAELMPSRWRGPDLPIESITKDAAAKFCQRAGGRLPTEAEWEFACRAGGDGRFWFGDDESDLTRHAWVKANSELRTHPVGLFEPNPFGLFDMHGNVWEWVSDRFHAYPAEPVTDPRGPEAGSTTIRGGSWWDVPKDVRSAKRLAWTAPQHNVGFRLAKSIGD